MSEVKRNDAPHLERDDYYRKHYGKNAIVNKLGRINIVHLDNPDKKEIQTRIEEVIREEITGEAYFDDCPLCRLTRDLPHDVVYYNR
jgi:hypothetical protein